MAGTIITIEFSVGKKRKIAAVLVPSTQYFKLGRNSFKVEGRNDKVSIVCCAFFYKYADGTIYHMCDLCLFRNLREKGRDLTQSYMYDKSPYTSRNFKRAK